MCFQLYAGTTKPIPRSEWDQSAPDLSVEALSERDAAIRTYFSGSEIQYIGSTSGCGCDFPHLTFQNGEWPWFESAEQDAELEASGRQNLEALVTLLQNTGEKTIELYGIWSGDFSEPKLREEIPVQALLDPKFHFKEQGFYKVIL